MMFLWLSDCSSWGLYRADLANLVNEAALLAGRQNKVVVEKEDFIQAVERSIAVLLLPSQNNALITK